MASRRDYESGFNNHSRSGDLNPSFDMPQFGGRFPFSQDQQGDPRTEGFCTFLKNVFCPKLNMYSFTSMVVVLNIIIFAWTCFLGLEIPGTLLQVDYKVLKKFGNYPIEIYEKNQVWRWASACFLHADFMHLFFNSVCILIVGSMIERAQGGLETGILYFISGVCGNIFTSVVSQSTDSVSVGASTCIYGLMAGLISFMIINWIAMEPYKTNRNYIMCILCCIIALIVMFSTGGTGQESTVDMNGHFGGFIGGLFFGLCVFSPLYKNSYEQNCRIIGAILGLFYLFIMIALFYTTKF